MTPNTPRIQPLCLALAVTAAISFPAQALATETQLETMTVTNVREGEKPKLRDEIVATESFSARDVEKTGATMLTEVLDKKPGISVQTECSICNVRNVVLNNLPGRFTTLLIDGIPVFSSVSSAYGLDSVSLGGVERIDIARGAGASLIAPEALAGTVSIVTRRPTENEFLFNQQVGSFGNVVSDAFAARAFSGGALTANFNHNEHDSVDDDGNRVSEYAGFKRNLGGVGFFVDDAGGFKVRGRLDFVDEKRMGGALGDDYDAVKADGSGNPFDWSQGKNGSPSSAGWVAVDGADLDGDGTLDIAPGGIVPYDDGLAGMSEIIFTDRRQFITSGTRKLGDGSLRLAFGYANHKQDSFYEKATYKANQDQYYFEASTQQPVGETLLTAGLDYRYEDLSSTGTDAAGNNNDGIDNYVYRTPGLFLQAYRAFWDDRLEVNGSVRFDDHNVFGNIVSPRLNLLWNHDAQLNSRLSVGKGFRAPTSFFEQDHGILDTTRIVRDIDQPETSQNASYTLSFASDRLSWVGGLHWNRIEDMALLDSGQCENAGGTGMIGPCVGNGLDGPAVTVFTSAENPVTVKSADLSLTYKLTPRLDGTLGFEKSHYDFDPGTLAFSRPEERVYITLDYESGPLDLLTRATWTGKQDLARFYDYAGTPRYNFDGTPKMNKSPSFWVVDLRGEYKVNKQWRTFLGIDNVFDFEQSDKESMLWVDGAGSIDVTQIWGPNRGRFIYGGVKFSL